MTRGLRLVPRPPGPRERLALLAGRAVAAVLLALAAPLLGLLAWRWGVAFSRTRRTGRGGRPFEELAWPPEVSRDWPLAERLRARHWPALVNVMRGEMALVGPRARACDELDADDPRAGALLTLQPGLVGPWWIRCRRGLDFGSELEVDLEYVRQRSPIGDAGLFLRAAAALLFGAERTGDGLDCRVLGVRIDNMAMEDAVEKLATLAGGVAPSQVCFANADCLNLACRDDAYRETLARARLVLPDGVGIRLATRLSGTTVRHNVNGTDLFPRLCPRLARDRRRVFLLGAKPGVVEKVRGWLEAHHPGVTVAGTQHGYFPASEEPDVIRRIRDARVDVLLVAFGAPRQDVWIREHLPRLGVRLALGVGGLFDFYSDAVPRAPLWMREMGLEWAYRLAQEPRRLWRRYVIGNALFLSRVGLEAAGVLRYAATGDIVADAEAAA